ncbi:MAG: glucose 1-dehydrogenase [Cellulosilyticum sp.]|nr:glucose 1-dehydrogenase [Cellulosilyticum sp.]
MFKNEIVLVTGSSRGIGKAIAHAFAKKGAKVILNAATSKERLLKTYESFVAAGYEVTYFFGDLSDFSTAQALFMHIKSQFGNFPTIIINNAGISHVGLFTETTPELWNKILTINLNSAYNCSYLGTPSMISHHQGCIINITSIWGNVGASCEVAYSTSKAALNGFTKSLAKELGPSNIRVNAIACGWIDTDMTSCYSEEEKEAFVDEIPLCRTGQTEDIAKACLYLASQDASYVTGQILTVDGGLL